jgi:hypothetical protein
VIREQQSAALLASADWLPPTSFSQQAFTGAQYGGVAPTRNPRALPQGGVERQQRKPSQRDSPHMDTELLLFLFAIVVDAVVVVAVVVVAVVFAVLPAPSTIPNYDRMSAATLVANSRSAPRCAPRALPQDDLGAGAPQYPRLPSLRFRGPLPIGHSRPIRVRHVRHGCGTGLPGATRSSREPPAPRLPQPHVQGRGHSPSHTSSAEATPPPPGRGRTAAKGTLP